jgi:hypothetical protein
MRRFALAVVLASCAALAPAAPVPRAVADKEQLAALWGTFEGQGEFDLNGKQLTLRSPLQPAQSLIKSSAATVPRAVRTVSGDFEAVAKLIEAAPPLKAARHADSYPATRAGIFVSGDNHAIELHLYQYHTKNKGELGDLNRTLWIDTWYPQGGSGSSLKQPEAGKTIHLKLVRKGKDVTAAYSFDGTEWASARVPRADMQFPDEVKVGVYLAPSTYQIASATFDSFVVNKPKDEKKK